MLWFILKGVLMALLIFVIMGIVGNIVCGMVFFLFSATSNQNIKRFLRLSVSISFTIGLFFFFVMGMFYASYTLLLAEHFAKWLVITFTIIFLLIMYRYTFKEVQSLHKKNALISAYEFYKKDKYLKHIRVVNESILLGGIILLPSYIFFLIFNNLADTLSLGINSYLISFFK